MTGKINSHGTTIHLLKVNSETLTNFYGDRKSQFMSLPDVEPGQKDFRIIAKDSWEEVAFNDSEVLSEGMILQLLYLSISSHKLTSVSLNNDDTCSNPLPQNSIEKFLLTCIMLTLNTTSRQSEQYQR